VREALGIIGVGLLGTALAERALAGGFEVLGYDPDECRLAELARMGGRAVASAGEIAAGSRRILLVLPHDGVSAEVVSGIESALPAGAAILDATTGDPQRAVELAVRLEARQVEYLDTTVSGSSEQARHGAALLMVGGTEEAFRRHRPVFDVLANETVHTGPCGSAARMKLVTNLVLGLNRAALAEGLVFARALGLDPNRSLEVLRASAAYSRIMDGKGPKMVSGNYEPQARLSQHLKDVRLMVAAGSDAGRRLPLTETHCMLLETAEGMGLGNLDNSAVLLAIDALSQEAFG
jgi:3-hydroxyisobutyrate dehydrogenase-like beta-hydroxyacid dehydrogenase